MSDKCTELMEDMRGAAGLDEGYGDPMTPEMKAKLKKGKVAVQGAKTAINDLFVFARGLRGFQMTEMNMQNAAARGDDAIVDKHIEWLEKTRRDAVVALRYLKKKFK